MSTQTTEQDRRNIRIFRLISDYWSNAPMITACFSTWCFVNIIYSRYTSAEPVRQLTGNGGILQGAETTLGAASASGGSICIRRVRLNRGICGVGGGDAVQPHPPQLIGQCKTERHTKTNRNVLNYRWKGGWNADLIPNKPRSLAIRTALSWHNGTTSLRLRSLLRCVPKSVYSSEFVNIGIPFEKLTCITTLDTNRGTMLGPAKDGTLLVLLVLHALVVLAQAADEGIITEHFLVQLQGGSEDEAHQLAAEHGFDGARKVGTVLVATRTNQMSKLTCCYLQWQRCRCSVLCGLILTGQVLYKDVFDLKITNFISFNNTVNILQMLLPKIQTYDT